MSTRVSKDVKKCAWKDRNGVQTLVCQRQACNPGTRASLPLHSVREGGEPQARRPLTSDHARFSLQLADDRMALVSGVSLDPEAAIGVTKRSPPKWVDGVDEVSPSVCPFVCLLSLDDNMVENRCVLRHWHV